MSENYEEIAKAIIDKRANKGIEVIHEGDHTDEEWDELQKSRSYLDAADISFTEMSKDKDLMATFN